MIPAETTLNPSRFQQVAIYNQPDPAAAGYNPNEEHALLAPSLRYASVSPRPSAVYALRNNDLNVYFASSNGEVNQPPGYTSHPYVLVQFFDVLDQEFKMRVYFVVKEDQLLQGFPYRFANPSKLVGSTSPRTLLAEPHVTMKAGEPVIPFYPLGQVIGAVSPPETFGSNLMSQAVFWKDHKLSTWAVSGGSNAWFTMSFYYPLLPDFWWPTNLPAAIDTKTNAVLPKVGSSVSFLPTNVQAMANHSCRRASK